MPAFLVDELGSQRCGKLNLARPVEGQEAAGEFGESERQARALQLLLQVAGVAGKHLLTPHQKRAHLLAQSREEMTGNGGWIGSGGKGVIKRDGPLGTVEKQRVKLAQQVAVSSAPIANQGALKSQSSWSPVLGNDTKEALGLAPGKTVLQDTVGKVHWVRSTVQAGHGILCVSKTLGRHNSQCDVFDEPIFNGRKSTICVAGAAAVEASRARGGPRW